MARKKSKRPNLSQETLDRARAEIRGERLAPVAAETASAAAPVAGKPKVAKRPGANLATRRIPSLEELIAEYGYVLSDLRNLAILAGILLLIIIAAAVLLPRPTG